MSNCGHCSDVTWRCRDRQTYWQTDRQSLDEDKAGVGARITLTRLDVATDQLPLAMTAANGDSLPGGLTLVDAMTSAASTWTDRRLQCSELLALDAHHATSRQCTSPVLTLTRWPRLRHLELGTVAAARNAFKLRNLHPLKDKDVNWLHLSIKV